MRNRLAFFVSTAVALIGVASAIFSFVDLAALFSTGEQYRFGTEVESWRYLTKLRYMAVGACELAISIAMVLAWFFYVRSRRVVFLVLQLASLLILILAMTVL